MSKEEYRQSLIKLVNDEDFIRRSNEQKSDMDRDLLTPRLGPSGVFYYGFYMDGGSEIPEIYIENVNHDDVDTDNIFDRRHRVYKYVVRDDTIVPSNPDQEPTDIFISKGREIDYKGGESK